MGFHRDIVEADTHGIRREIIRNWGERCYESDRLGGWTHCLSHQRRRKFKNETTQLIKDALNEKSKNYC